MFRRWRFNCVRCNDCKENSRKFGYFFLKVTICNSEQTLREEYLQLLHKEVLGVINADKGADHVARFVRSEILCVSKSSCE